MILICAPMLLPDYGTVTALGVLWIVFSLMVYEHTRPFVDKKSEVLMRLSQYQLLLTLFCGLLMKYEVMR